MKPTIKSLAFVYKITNVLTGKVYIGKTIQTPELRWAEHLYTARNPNVAGSKYLCSAIRKYGEENFKLSVLHKCESDLLEEAEFSALELEKQEISNYNSNNSEFGYNLTLGGDGRSGYKLTPEQVQNCKDSWTAERRALFASKISDTWTEERRVQASTTMLGESNPNFGKGIYGEDNPAKRPEVRAKLSEKLSGSGNPMYGKVHTESSKKLISESSAGASNPSVKLTENQVKDILIQYYILNFSKGTIASKYPQVHPGTVFKIINRKTWKSISLEELISSHRFKLNSYKFLTKS